VISVSSLKSFRYLVALGEAVQSFKVNKVGNKTSTEKRWRYRFGLLMFYS
jgi:hypothetical protein